MANDAILCPRCLRAIPSGGNAKFCPRCGLRDVDRAASDSAPKDVSVSGRTYRVLDRIAVGSICNLYRCHPSGVSGEWVFKVARDARVNDHLTNEAAILSRLRNGDAEGRFAPFLPAVVESFDMSEEASPARRANILRLHDEIASPDELYTLSEVHEHYQGRLDPRDTAWMWRRLLSILGFAHTHDVAHGAVVPDHVLIEPREHKLVLIDWCCARTLLEQGRRPRIVFGSRYIPWYQSEASLGRTPTPALDVALGARCMIMLIGGDPATGQMPAGLDAGLQRYFRRCFGNVMGAAIDAWKLLEDFDRLIEACWGARQFRELPLPPRRRGAGLRGG